MPAKVISKEPIRCAPTAPNASIDRPDCISITTSAASWAVRTSGDTVTVTASYTFQPSLGAFTKLATKNFHATSTLTIP